jgi:hypothetical protein
MRKVIVAPFIYLSLLNEKSDCRTLYLLITAQMRKVIVAPSIYLSLLK